MLRNLRNQVSFFGGGRSSRPGPTSLVNQLSNNVNRMTQSMMDRMMPNMQQRSSILTDNTLNGNVGNVDMVPIDVLLRQQRTLQNSLNVPEPTPQQSQTVLVVPVGQNRQWGTTLTDTVLPQMARDGVNVVVVERNETSGTNQPTITRTSTTRISDPNLSNSSVDALLTRLKTNAPGTVSSFLTGTPDNTGKMNFDTFAQTNGNGVVSVPGSGSFIILDGNAVDPQTMAIAGNSVPGQNSPSTDAINRNVGGRNVLGLDPSLPFGGGFPTRQRGNTEKRSGKSTARTQSSISNTASPVTQAGAQDVTQSRSTGMGVPVDPNAGQTFGSSLIYSQDTVRYVLYVYPPFTYE